MLRYSMQPGKPSMQARWGGDCYALDHVEVLSAHPSHMQVVLGPAFDGGYYLLGLTTEAPELFQVGPIL